MCVCVNDDVSMKSAAKHRVHLKKMKNKIVGPTVDLYFEMN